MWLLASIALADDLVLTDLRLDASNGVTLDYALSPATYEACADSLRRTGSAPMLMVTVSAGGMTRTQAVELKEQVRTGVSIASGTWPTGLTASVAIRNGGSFDRLRGPSGSGATLRVAVSGGTPGGDPLGGLGSTGSSQSSSSSSGGWTVQPQPQPVPEPYAPAPQPVQVDPQEILRATQEAERLLQEAELARQRQEELDRLRAEQAAAAAAERARVEGIGNDGSHPLAQACGAGFSGDRYWDCVWKAVYRVDGAAEVAGCGRMERPGLRLECLESMEKRAYQAGVAVNACVDVFGPEVQSMRCLNAVVESPDDPSTDVRVCGQGFGTVEDQMACIKRLHLMPWDPTDLVAACNAGFDVPIECVHRAVRPDGVDAAMVRACGEAFDDGVGLECIYELKGARPGDRAGVVPVCVALFPGDTKAELKCLERARRDPDPGRIQGCASEESPGRRLKCVEG